MTKYRSQYEMHIKQLYNVAPNMSFQTAHNMATEWEKQRDDAGAQSFTVLMLLEIMGINDNGWFPKEVLDRVSNEKDPAKRTMMEYALHTAGQCHGGHSCGIPGYEASIRDYNEKYIIGADRNIREVLKSYMESQNNVAKEKEERI